MEHIPEQASILEYWRSTELFSPQTIPQLGSETHTDLVFKALADSPLPWSPSHPIQARHLSNKQAWRYHAYCGIYSHDTIKEILEEKFGEDPESFDERRDGESCIFAFTISSDGLALLNSFVLSSSAWSTARAVDPGPQDPSWLEGFEAESVRVIEEFTKRLAIYQQDGGSQGEKRSGRSLTYRDLAQVTQHLAQELGFPLHPEDVEIRIKADVIDTEKQSIYEPAFFNSFFIKDLRKVATEIRNEVQGAGLTTLLAAKESLNTSKRVDIRQSLRTQINTLSPQNIPRGRWPNNGHFPLNFSQQLAINSIYKKLQSEPGLFAVNGPPGTGKTTLLRDLIAAVVVERAVCLSTLIDPKHAFNGEKRWRKSNGSTRVISSWKDEFKGFEIVIASSNNGAVENISQEIPGLDAIDPSWSESTDYFADYATHLIEKPAWAMASARLGKKSNRKKFVDRFWYEEEKSVEKEPLLLFRELLKNLALKPQNWNKAVLDFNRALAQEQQLREDRQQAYQLYSDSLQAELEIAAAEAIQAEQSTLLEPVEKSLNETWATEQSLAKIRKDALERRSRHRQFRPGLLKILLTLGIALWRWMRKNKELGRKVGEADSRLAAGKLQTLAQRRKFQTQERQVQEAKQTLNKTQQRLTELNHHLKPYKDQLGGYFPDYKNWHQDEIAREKSSPWTDPAWNQARADLFLAALQLHKAFLSANADRMRKSLHGAMDVISGSVPDSASVEAVQAAWTAFFMVIPVVSTTFASFDRQFAHLGRESLGWLLIDEAGQAVPQAAVGAIWRSKRTVVVGDPLQLEPVFTLPFTVQQALRRYHQVEETWLPGCTSVQQLADRVNLLGTYLKRDDDPLWVGSPLRVHRRCDRLMFEISNAVAYDGLMVFGTPERQPSPLPPSRWFDVESQHSEGHWVPAEGERLMKLLNEIMDQGGLSRDIFMISPFRDVVKQLRQIAEVYRGLKAGTIHTVQGKESDVVILILGGNPQNPGAKHWASARPNLLNVAVSRAKRRLYVIGSRRSWKQYRYFSTSISLLENTMHH